MGSSLQKQNYRLPLFLWITVFTLHTLVYAVESPTKENKPTTTWEFLSDKGRMFPALRADPREAQIRVAWLYHGNSNNYMDIGLGGDLGFLRKTFPSGKILSITVRGLVTARFHLFSQSFDLLNTDFIGGSALAYGTPDDAWELLFFHTSSHLGDDPMEHATRGRINYSMETMRLLYSRRPWPTLRLYGGPEIKVRADPPHFAGKITLRIGAEWYFLPSTPSLFAALDLQSREENDWAINASFQVGYELGNPEQVFKRQRIFFEIFNGHSNMGQYYDTQEFYVLAGIGFTY